jgi:hypothetical protein
MQDRSVHAYAASTTERLLACSEEPATELPASVLVLDLFIIFQIISNDKTRTTPTPLSATDFLLSPTSNNPKLMPIVTLHNDISFSALHESFDLEVTD